MKNLLAKQEELGKSNIEVKSYQEKTEPLMKKLEEIAQKMGGGAVEVGFMEGATYPDGTPVPAVAPAYMLPFPVPAAVAAIMAATWAA